MVSLLRELAAYMSARKKWWLTPVIAVLFIVGGLLVLVTVGGCGQMTMAGCLLGPPILGAMGAVTGGVVGFMVGAVLGLLHIRRPRIQRLGRRRHGR